MSAKAVKITVILASLLACQATMEGSQLSSKASLQAMEQVFKRSHEEHTASMSRMMESMSPKKAMRVLEERNLTFPALLEVTSHLQDKKSHLRATTTAKPTGYAAVEGARKLLNEMIYVSMSKYDQEIAKCTEFYSEQCAAMMKCRGDISDSNFAAANSRAKILEAQSAINRAEQDIPPRKLELNKHNTKCENAKKNALDRLEVIEADIKAIGDILAMTECATSASSTPFFLQLGQVSLRHCRNECTKESFISFDHEELRERVSRLKSQVAHSLLQDTFKDFFEGVESLNLLETSPLVNKTTFNNPPVPRTLLPADPCNDKFNGAPTPDDISKGKSTCTISQSPECYKIRERFVNIQAGINDEKDNLMKEIAAMEKGCKATRDILQTQLDNDNNKLREAQLGLAEGTKQEAQAGEDARQTAREHNQLDKDLKTQMKSCSLNYINFESELCALKKIRGELYTKMSKPAYFTDCEVSKWKEEECSKECAGGEQKLVRSVLTAPKDGAKCLPLTALKKCNLDPCPVNCKLSPWDGWSKCSAECDGGVQERSRNINVMPKNGGKPCDQTTQTRSCNSHACDKDCEVGEWTEWGTCSKDCDGGRKMRQKFVTAPAKGNGVQCPSKTDKKRLQFKQCNMHRCQLMMGAQVLQCQEKLDVVLLLDGSGSMGTKGWAAQMKAASLFVDGFAGTGAQANVAVILYSGPGRMTQVRGCWRGRKATRVLRWRTYRRGRRRIRRKRWTWTYSKERPSLSNDCKIKTVQHLSSNMATVKSTLKSLKWPKGSTMTSMALGAAKTELANGRSDAKKIVVAITDGRPMSSRRTGRAARSLRAAAPRGAGARLVWVPVTRNAPFHKVKRWASFPWKENVVRVKTFKDLEKPDPINHVMANICKNTNR